MIKKKLSRIEDFISPTCFSYQDNAFRYSYKFPSTLTLYKTKHDSSFYFLDFIIRTKLMPCYARQANEVVVLPRWCPTLPRYAKICFANQSKLSRSEVRCTSEVNAYITNASLASLKRCTSEARNTYKAYVLLTFRKGCISKASKRDTLCRASRSEAKHVKRRFAKQTLAGAVRQRSKQGALYTKYLIDHTREGSLSTFRKIRSQKITTIFFNSTDTTSYIIIRPLINCSRKSITITCRLARLPVYPDLSNLKLRYSRNRIRKQIIPTLKFFLNPKLEKSLFKFSENLE